MSNIFTKTREGAKVPSRKADYLQFDQKVRPIVANRNDLGSPNTDQTVHGVFYPNVQAAIDDLASLTLGNINDVVINTSGDSPQGTQQVGTIAFDGTVVFPNEFDPAVPVIVQILGFPVSLNSGDPASAVATNFKNATEATVIEGKVFDQVQVMSSDAKVVQFRHADYVAHTYESLKMYGITATITVSAPARNGLGTWVKLGQEAKTFDGATAPVTLHYYKRIA